MCTTPIQSLIDALPGKVSSKTGDAYGRKRRIESDTFISFVMVKKAARWEELTPSLTRLCCDALGDFSMLNATDDVRIDNLRPLLPPATLTELPCRGMCDWLHPENRRYRVNAMIGFGCGWSLFGTRPKSRSRICVSLEKIRESRRLSSGCDGVYFEKPRTTVGWKGLINDPSSMAVLISTPLAQARSSYAR